MCPDSTFYQVHIPARSRDRRLIQRTVNASNAKLLIQIVQYVLEWQFCLFDNFCYNFMIYSAIFFQSKSLVYAHFKM